MVENELFQFADIVQREFARLCELGHYWLGPATEEAKNLIQKILPGDVPGNGGLIDMSVADLSYTPDGLLCLQPVHGGLHCGVSGPGSGKAS